MCIRDSISTSLKPFRIIQIVGFIAALVIIAILSLLYFKLATRSKIVHRSYEILSGLNKQIDLVSEISFHVRSQSWNATAIQSAIQAARIVNLVESLESTAVSTLEQTHKLSNLISRTFIEDVSVVMRAPDSTEKTEIVYLEEAIHNFTEFTKSPRVTSSDSDAFYFVTHNGVARINKEIERLQSAVYLNIREFIHTFQMVYLRCIVAIFAAYLIVSVPVYHRNRKTTDAYDQAIEEYVAHHHNNLTTDQNITNRPTGSEDTNAQGRESNLCEVSALTFQSFHSPFLQSVTSGGLVTLLIAHERKFWKQMISVIASCNEIKISGRQLVSPTN
eukprot:TRINITY_DN12594_c0_g1_i2.p1 TRINITY_DN12594_c0_g1~~TRINITY_DN12594_c0_g1_i2.p1  ORF type:complete len:332 (-),score=15.02 TRINITY_DN12594_c0_g1_i2:737-1732(-)